MTAYDRMPGWKQSTSTYIAARHAYLDGDEDKALELLSAAIAHAEGDARGDSAGARETPHLPYYCMRARLHHRIGLAADARGNGTAAKVHFDAAFQDWSRLSRAYETLRFASPYPDNYQRALVALYSVATADKSSTPFDSETAQRASTPPATGFSRRTFLEARTNRYDLARKGRLADALAANPAEPPKLPSLDFVIIE
jgi:hypothetical protein